MAVGHTRWIIYNMVCISYTFSQQNVQYVLMFKNVIYEQIKTIMMALSNCPRACIIPLTYKIIAFSE